MTSPTIGLFGTCGNSRWRDTFIEAYARHGIPYFNPQVAPGAWNPDQARDEAWHLANDALVLFPITSETLAMGSLAEVGFSSQIRSNGTRYVVIFVAPDVDPALYAENNDAAKGSRRARTLVREHLRKVENPNVFIVESLSEMLETSLKLYASLRLLQSARNPAEHPWQDLVESSLWHELPQVRA